MPVPEPSGLPGGTPRRVAAVRGDNLGDLILFSGVLGPLRRLFPHARITLYVKESLAGLLERCPEVDEVASWEDLLWPLRRRWPYFKGRDRLDRVWSRGRGYLRPRPHLVVMPLRSPSPLTHLAVSRLRGRAVLGWEGDLSNQTGEERSRWGHLYSREFPPPPGEPSSELEWNAHWLKALAQWAAARRDGASSPFPGTPRVPGGHPHSEPAAGEVQPRVWLSEEDYRWARESLTRVDGTRLLLLAPGVTSTPGKFYPAARWREALEGVEGGPFSVHLLGSPDEREMNAQVAKALQGTPNVRLLRDHTGTTSLRQLAAGLHQGDLVVAQETGALHLATAVGTPTVGILGGGHHGRFYPWGDPESNRVADHPMECYHCNWVCRYSKIRCIQEIPPERIAREMTAALTAGRPRPGAAGSGILPSPTPE